MQPQTPTVTVDDLRQFCAKHFPHAPLPRNYLNGVENQGQKPDNGTGNDGLEGYEDDGEDGLGYYEDGVKRTLTDEQIAMFRHSEIQRILLERRHRKEAGLPIDASPEVDMQNVTAPSESVSIREASPASVQSTPMSISDDEEAESVAEKPQQKWTALSARSRAKNAANRKKNRKNWRARKNEERKKQKKEEKEARRRAAAGEDEDEESDEWDPWHQAKGPDVQQEETVDLDY